MDQNKTHKKWKTGDICEIYSNSKKKWGKGKIIKILKGTYEEGEWFKIRFDGSNTVTIIRNTSWIKSYTLNYPSQIRIEDTEIDEKYEIEGREKFFKDNNDENIPIEPIYNAVKKV
eukprot:797057_1